MKTTTTNKTLNENIQTIKQDAGHGYRHVQQTLEATLTDPAITTSQVKNLIQYLTSGDML